MGEKEDIWTCNNEPLLLLLIIHAFTQNFLCRIPILLSCGRDAVLHHHGRLQGLDAVSGTSEHVEVCVKEGIVPKMTELLSSPSDDVREHEAVRASRSNGRDGRHGKGCCNEHERHS